MEASGWPSWCLADEDKDAYNQEVHVKEGIVLEKEKVEVNPGL